MWDNHRLLNRIASLLFAGAAVALLAAVAWRAAQLPVFGMREVRVDTPLVRVTPEQLEGVARHAVRGSFFTLDLEDVRAQFETLPWVRKAKVRRAWPARLVLHVEEHAAFARWGDSALVNTHGEVFEAATDEKLPVFIGPDGQAQELVRRYRKLAAQLAAIERRPVRVRLSARGAWTVKLDDGLTLELGRTDVDERVDRFISVYERTIARLPQAVTLVDLRYANGFAVRLPEARGRNAKS